MIHIEPFTVLSIYDAINTIGSSKSSTNNIHTFKVRPLDQMLFKQLQQFSQKELENFNTPIPHKPTLFEACILSDNSFIFAALIEKNTFIDRLSDVSQWIIHNFDDIDINLYDYLFDIEKRKLHYEQRYSGINNSVNLKIYSFNNILNYLHQNESPFSTQLANLFFDKYADQMEGEIYKYIFKHIEKPTYLVELLFNKIQEHNIDINYYEPLNSLLPNFNNGKNKLTALDSSFFHQQSGIFRLDPSVFNKISLLLDRGFTFNEDNYLYNNDTFITAILKSGNPLFVKTLLPHLKRIIPTDHTTFLAQHSLLDKLKLHKDYDFIYELYLDKLNTIVPVSKNNQIVKRKMKI